MPLAVTHVILTIILVDLYRDYVATHRKYFTLHTVMVAGVAGLLPDIDILISWLLTTLGYSVSLVEHGMVTHTALFGLVFLIPGLVFLKKNKHKTAMYFFVIAFGILFHVFLDYLLVSDLRGGVMWFWPLSTAMYKVNLLGLESGEFLLALDAVILLLWLWHEEAKHKIKDFI